MNARLAVVDDDPDFAELLATLLRARDFGVDVYHSGPELLGALTRGAHPHVILLDVLMPHQDGLSTLRDVRQAAPGAAVIMVSGGQTPSTIVEALRLGASDYVVKPTTVDDAAEATLTSAIFRAMPAELGGTLPSSATDSAMREVLQMMDRVADSPVDVLLRGESGSGKDVLAREIHRRSPRAHHPFVKVNCAALPAELLESELFGHERGAFTGAHSTRIGQFEFADGGTIMLDEIGELPLALQAKLLHVLQDRQFTRLGQNRITNVDVRVIAATNRNLEHMMRERTFREDLYYRLQVVQMYMPPLRERRDEIPGLVACFLDRHAGLTRHGVPTPSARLTSALMAAPWPGNIRELENTIKRFIVLQDEDRILQDLTSSAVPLSPSSPAMPEPVPALPREVDAVSAPQGHTSSPVDLQALARSAAMQAERVAIDRALVQFRWNRRKVASHLRVSYKTLLTKMKECGITEPDNARRSS